MHSSKLKNIEDYLSQFKLDDSLLFLNHLLGVSRGFSSDDALLGRIKKSSLPVLPHNAHFIAKLLLLNASNLGRTPMGWEQFLYAQRLCVDLDDPITEDPNWSSCDPSGFFERLLAQQVGPQNRMLPQKYGLALRLFRDVGTVEHPQRFDLRQDLEAILRISVEQFIGLGHTTFALSGANYAGIRCMGTFKKELLTLGFAQGLSFCVPEVWGPFLRRVAVHRDEFRKVANQPEYVVEDENHSQFSFNPLRRFPICELGHDRFLAPDPELIIERVTSGLFYDLFEAHGTEFSKQFGYAFEKFVGSLISTVGNPKQFWSASDWEMRQIRKPQNQKVTDWAFKGAKYTILLECKSLRPSLNLTTFGSEKSMDELRNRVKDAVLQLTIHAEGINAGKWKQEGLHAASHLGIVVTYGKFYAVNGPIAKRRIRDELVKDGITPIPFVILSIGELDSVIRLVELGHSFDEIVHSITSDELHFDPLTVFSEELKDNATSAKTMATGQAFLDRVVAGTLVACD
jgi:hypothetical protein